MLVVVGCGVGALGCCWCIVMCCVGGCGMVGRAGQDRLFGWEVCVVVRG